MLLITLYITPVIYIFLDGIQEKVSGRVPFFRSEELSRDRMPSLQK